jgi:UDP-N-acetylglucosamine--N-acetylmuramyl-(pentapeptide) pyrophosphoryl-undecaprenol N-acetylglucosamine transferase
MKGRNIIILSGGGTGGSVTPLLALVTDLKNLGFEAVWVGTKSGIEREIVSQIKLRYISISAGKFRRYVSFQNILDPFRILIGFFESLSLLSKIQPSLVMTAGGYVSVPLVWAAWALRIPIIVHQQDIIPGLANRLMAPFAHNITVTFEQNVKNYGEKAIWTGNPVREEFLNTSLENNINTDSGDDKHSKRILVIGGGTGSEVINRLVLESLSVLTSITSIVHITGREIDKEKVLMERYIPYTFLTANLLAQEMKKADVIISRAGMGTLTELSFLGKPTIIIPMPHSHQEANARLFLNQGAAIVLEEEHLTPEQFIGTVKDLLDNNEKQNKLARQIKSVIKKEAEKNILSVIKSLLRK